MLRPLNLLSILAVAILTNTSAIAQPGAEFLEKHCFECHDDLESKGGLNLLDAAFEPGDRENFELWVKVHDMVDSGEMPPDDEARPDTRETTAFLSALSGPLTDADPERVTEHGRASVRRLNRLEYENALRQLLNAPWLLVANHLPEDSMAHGFNKSGESLDVSHVQMQKFLSVGEDAVRAAVNAAAHRPETRRFHAREEELLLRYMKTLAINRAVVPLLGWEAQREVIFGEQPKSAWGEPEIREREAMAMFVGSKTNATRADFRKMDPPISGRYRLRLKSYSIVAGANGTGGKGLGFDPDGPSKPFFPDKRDIRRADRPEPVSLYAMKASGDSRLIAQFDAQPEPHVVEREVVLEKGDDIRVDPVRLVRYEANWSGNPFQGPDSIPGYAMNWLEIEGPITEEWPPESYRAVFGDLPFEVRNGEVRALPRDEDRDAEQLLGDFFSRSRFGRPVAPESLAESLGLYRVARELGYDFTDAMIQACTAILCSPEFLYLDPPPGRLPPDSLAARLAYFLWNSPPDRQLLAARGLDEDPEILREQTARLLAGPKADRFVHGFLDYWLDLREINDTSPDAELYPEYSTDVLLVESALAETRLFFKTLLTENLPARTFIDSDFAFVNERLARHYGLDVPEMSVELRRVNLPTESPRGGLLTQASVLKITANGTTTSPVLRGVWIAERLLGIEIGLPPSGVEAIEPDTRGATTIREQLAKHIETESCAACHLKFDPIGFGLESFDVFGGWQDRYRALGEIGDPVEGFGIDGRAISYRLARPVESGSTLMSGEAFQHVHDLKKLLLRDERAIARNLLEHLVVYATGAPVSFSERGEIEAILDAAEESDYGVRDLVHALLQSLMFRQK